MSIPTLITLLFTCHNQNVHRTPLSIILQFIVRGHWSTRKCRKYAIHLTMSRYTSAPCHGTNRAHKKKDKWKQINTFYMDCPVIKRWRVQIPLTGLALPNVCTFHKQGPGLPASYVVVFLCSASSVKMRSAC